MTAPTITLSRLAKLDSCEDKIAEMREKLPKRRRITAQMARAAGVSFDDIAWAASAMARVDKDVDRRLRLWAADCAAHVLHIYEKYETNTAPRDAIIASRQYTRGEIGEAARDAIRAAALAAARDAATGAAEKAAALAATRAAARDFAWEAAWDAIQAVARDAATGVAARAAARDAEESWQFDRLIMWLSDNEPED